MLFFKYILIVSVFITGWLHTENTTHAMVPIRWAVQKASTLRVEGQSNINEFRCDIDSYYQPDTIICYDEGGNSKSARLKGSVTIDLFTFDCHSKMITNDLRKTLKAEEHPRMIIHFISLERAPLFIGNTDIVKGIVSIELAGITKRFEILYSFIKNGPASMILNGGRNFNFSDFNLTAPRKLAGLIQIKDAFNVKFRLTLIEF